MRAGLGGIALGGESGPVLDSDTEGPPVPGGGDLVVA